MTAVGGCGSMSGGGEGRGGDLSPIPSLGRSLACVYTRAKKVQVTVF